MATASARVERMLAMVPFIVNHQGVSLEELSRVFGAPEADIRRDLDLLFMTGIPPYGPGDLVEVDIENGQVWIAMADHLERPQRLTRPEAVSLYVRARTLAGTPGIVESEALDSALSKIEEAIGAEALGELVGHVETAEDPAEGRTLDTLKLACEASEALQISYFSYYSDALTERTIEPEDLFWASGHWYVAAWDPAAGGERIFRLDRIREIRATGIRFRPRGLRGAGRSLYTPSAADTRVRLRLAPGAFWIVEYYGCTEVVERQGFTEATLSTRWTPWIVKLALRLGGAMTILEPEDLRAQVVELARTTLAAYRT